MPDRADELNLPIAQGVQALAALESSSIVPAAQSVHDSLDSAEYLPTVHAVQAVAGKPSSSAVPAMHSEHDVAPAAACDPAAHSAHAAYKKVSTVVDVQLSSVVQLSAAPPPPVESAPTPGA